MADLKDMEGPIKFKKGVELYYDPKKDMFYDEKKKKYVKEKDIIKMVESSEDGAKTLNMEDDLNLSFSKMFDLYKEYQTKRIFEKIKSKKKLKDDRIEEGRDEEYEKFFQSALKKFGVSSPSELKGDKKKEFFDYIDKNWEGENEEDEEETIEELNIGMSFAGNGLSVYDRDRESSGDYMKIAHVQGKPNKKVKDGDDITLNIYDKKKSNHKAIIAKVEKSFPKSKIKVDDRSKMKMTQEETIGEKEFKPHMMYDPETGKAYKAEKPEDHERMSKLGYTHEKPKKIEEETVEESRIRLSSLMNGGALLYDRDEDPDDDKLATVKVKGNPKKDIKNGDDLVLSLMDKGKSKEKEILKSLKKYYPKSKVVKEENIEEVKMHPALRKLQTALKKFHKGSELDDLVPEYGAKIVDGKKVYSIEYKKGKKEGEEFAKSLQKALKASSFSVMPYRGDDSMVSIEIKEETVSPKMAAYLNFLNKNLEEGKKDYEIYHNTFSSAIDEVKKFAKKNGYELDDDDLFHTVGTGPKKPSTGKTNKYHLTLMKNGKENKKKLHFQVYGMKTQYELNMYIS